MAGHRRLRIGIDGYNLAMARGTGVATYGRRLAETLRSMGHGVDGLFGIDVAGPAEHRETLFYDGLSQSAPSPGRRGQLRAASGLLTMGFGTRALDVPHGGVVTRELDGQLPPFDHLWSSAHLFARAHRYFRATGRFATVRVADPPAVMHWTYPLPLRLAGARNVYTLHDLVPLRLPFATLDAKRRYRALVAGCVRAADRICTVSETSRRDIVDLLGADPARVSNTYQVSAIDDALLAEDADTSAEQVAAILGLRRHGYFLFYGAIEPKKNLARLLEAYLGLGLDTPLVIVAARAWQSEGQLVLLPRPDDAGSPRHAHLERRIVQIDYLPRHLLLRLLRGARALAFPALYEGFGLPVLEAMQLGVPVLSSTTGAVPEIAGDAALLVDPYDVAAIGAGLARLDADAALRGALSGRGIARAALYSADRYRQSLDDLYRKTLERPA